jgi:hypothetical protein
MRNVKIVLVAVGLILGLGLSQAYAQGTGYA